MPAGRSGPAAGHATAPATTAPPPPARPTALGVPSDHRAQTLIRISLEPIRTAISGGGSLLPLGLPQQLAAVALELLVRGNVLGVLVTGAHHAPCVHADPLVAVVVDDDEDLVVLLEEISAKHALVEAADPGFASTFDDHPMGLMGVGGTITAAHHFGSFY